MANFVQVTDPDGHLFWVNLDNVNYMEDDGDFNEIIFTNKSTTYTKENASKILDFPTKPIVLISRKSLPEK
tara:strand:+ start:225 stop:437 length:213 start_codon:yes stop_codon:yes gene_type:complete